MSLYLEPIHHWLFNKILIFEDLEKEIKHIINSDSSVPYERWLYEITEKYGRPHDDKKLEDIIDTDNIHGWLQNRITLAELRYASWITRYVDANPKNIFKLQNVMKLHGSKLGVSAHYKLSSASPSEAFKLLNDYLLEGMPCDRVLHSLEETDDMISWKITSCLHKKYWDEVDGNISDFYNLRNNWIESFITSLNSELRYSIDTNNEINVYSISK